ncbi:nitronate monooxygenase [Pacificimonas sp. WHA3]|uniref:Nitronate monooxygenase n=1 Tax=Pacificimonas pallii TaxID=2827236 RepID=A0ABS6SFW6_9SPHN|nr:nitronate monooxygenase [Pacificimonas pallii]MBV7257302.1 nitronate monooxygenase [Pacificimonas pallii]
MKTINSIRMGAREVLPLVEGGKGVSATNGQSSGAWAAAGGIGTVSAVNADSYDDNGDIIPQIYHGRTRDDRHEELVRYGIDGGVAQLKQARDLAGPDATININVLWEMGGAQRILEGIFESEAGDLVDGVTCGAGMPYKLAEISARFGKYYYPIISSGRAFRALWKRSYSKHPDWLGAVVYEDPWLAGGHNGLSNAEDPEVPQDPYPRVKDLREVMRAGGISDDLPIIMAGGVWFLREWEDWIDNRDLGTIAFQFGSRPLLTKESPIPDIWKERLPKLSAGDILLHPFSPTGFYSSAVKTPFLMDMARRSERQIAFTAAADDTHTHKLDVGFKGNKTFWVTRADLMRARGWVGEGFTVAMKTPDDTLVFETDEMSKILRKDQADCMGCLSQCKFSSWAEHNEKHSTGRLADPRSFCIQKTLQDIAHGGDPDDNLMFAGHSAHHFSTDPFYSNGFVPTVKQLVDRILTGD